MHKYGREFSLGVMENHDGCVSDRVVKKLDMSTPPPELVDAYLTEIAKAYNVEWVATRKSGQDNGPEGEIKAPVTNPEHSSNQSHEKAFDDHEPPPRPMNSPSTEGIQPDAKSGSSPSQTTSLKGSMVLPSAPEPVNEDDFDALTRRFAALKKR